VSEYLDALIRRLEVEAHEQRAYAGQLRETKKASQRSCTLVRARAWVSSIQGICAAACRRACENCLAAVVATNAQGRTCLRSRRARLSQRPET
jgi:hypothetical protein